MPRVRQPGGAVLVRASTSAAELSPLFLGFDFGTSGARAVVIDGNATILADVKRKYPPAAHAESASESAVVRSSDPDSDVSAAEGWRAALFGLLLDIPEELRRQVVAVSLDGTSATTMVVSRSSYNEASSVWCNVVQCGATIAPPPSRLFHPFRVSALPAGSAEAVAAVAAVAPANHTTTAGTSTLCKLMTWWLRQGVGGGQGEGSGEEERQGRGGGGEGGKGEGEVVMVHQADWLLGQLCGAADVHVTDFNNALKPAVWGGAADVHVKDFNSALKLGYDPASGAYPAWLLALPFSPMLPRVLPPGSLIGSVAAQLTAEFALPSDCIVTTGTTDSIAAFLAARVTTPGYAVTSLGSTLAVKLVSTARIDDARFGVYSHRLPPGNWAPPEVENEGETEQGGAAEEDKECKWLVGGASNTGGAVLWGYFTDEQLRELSVKIDPSVGSKLDYYPLTRPGERFPVSDPDLQPRLTPRPADDALFLHGILESIATIEVRPCYLLPCPVTRFLVPSLASLSRHSLPCPVTRFLVPSLASLSRHSLPCPVTRFLVPSLASLSRHSLPCPVTRFLVPSLASLSRHSLPCPVTRFLVPSLASLSRHSLPCPVTRFLVPSLASLSRHSLPCPVTRFLVPSLASLSRHSLVFHLNLSSCTAFLNPLPL
ncbi:unnamed protein product [Closterium sp. NIES-65]|nr:unnamed protein product [Closterium sp. NIES-65]